MWSDGGKAITSTSGAKSWDSSWSSRFDGKTVYIWYDADESGIEGSRKAGASIARYADKVWAVRHSDIFGKDITEYLRNTGQTFSLPLLRSLPSERVHPPPRRKASSYKPTDGPKPDLGTVLRAYGIKAEKARAVALCPLHDDSSPSFSYDLEKGLWKCHAGCGAGDVYTFVELIEGCSFVESKEIISKL